MPLVFGMQSQPWKGRPGDQSMRGSQPKAGELKFATREAILGKIASGDQSMRGSQPKAGGLKLATGEAIPGKIAVRRSIHARQPFVRGLFGGRSRRTRCCRSSAD